VCAGKRWLSENRPAIGGCRPASTCSESDEVRPVHPRRNEVIAENAIAETADSTRILFPPLQLERLPAISGPSADTELVRLVAALDANQAEVEVLKAADPRDDPDLVARLTARLEVRHEMAERLAVMRATTLAGLRAKARALLACARLDRDSDDDWSNVDEVLGWSLARDLLGSEVAERDPRG
jgi:hypothetical protein